MLSKLFGLFKSGSDKPAGTSAAETSSSRPLLPPPLPRGAFADAYANHVRRHAPEIAVTRVDDGVRLDWPDGGTMQQS